MPFVGERMTVRSSSSAARFAIGDGAIERGLGLFHPRCAAAPGPPGGGDPRAPGSGSHSRSPGPARTWRLATSASACARASSKRLRSMTKSTCPRVTSCVVADLHRAHQSGDVRRDLQHVGTDASVPGPGLLLVVAPQPTARHHGGDHRDGGDGEAEDCLARGLHGEDRSRESQPRSWRESAVTAPQRRTNSARSKRARCQTSR